MSSEVICGFQLLVADYGGSATSRLCTILRIRRLYQAKKENISTHSHLRAQLRRKDDLKRSYGIGDWAPQKPVITERP